MIINNTPFRISFFGGGTDFPEFFTKTKIEEAKKYEKKDRKQNSVNKFSFFLRKKKKNQKKNEKK